MKDRANEEWLRALTGPGRDDALADLRALLMRGMRSALEDRASLSDADLEDFAQETLVRILAKLNTFEGRSRFTTSAHKTAVRVALSQLRRKRWRDVSVENFVKPFSEGDFTPAILIDPAGTPDKIAAQRILQDTVGCLIKEELTESQRRRCLSPSPVCPCRRSRSRWAQTATHCTSFCTTPASGLGRGCCATV